MTIINGYYSRCGTLMNPHCSMAMSADQSSKFAALHQQWWHLQMSEKFSSVTKNSKQKIQSRTLLPKKDLCCYLSKMNPILFYTILWGIHITGHMWFSSYGRINSLYAVIMDGQHQNLGHSCVFHCFASACGYGFGAQGSKTNTEKKTGKKSGNGHIF